jgi:RNA polymerase sigma factor (TIGR02999 family)
MDNITQLLAAARGADVEAKNRLWQALYGELHGLAHAQLRRAGGANGSLDTTSLLHEAYIKMVRTDDVHGDSRGQFFSYASKVMRSIVIDICRERMSQRRGGGVADITLNTSISDTVARSDEDLVRISDALEELGKVHPRLVQVVEMRFFGGLTAVEIANALGVTTRTVERDWDKARMLMLAAVS